MFMPAKNSWASAIQARPLESRSDGNERREREGGRGPEIAMSCKLVGHAVCTPKTSGVTPTRWWTGWPTISAGCRSSRHPRRRAGGYRRAASRAPPDRGEPFDALFRDFRIVLPGMTHWNHPGWFAYFPCNNSPPSILAEMLTATIGRSACPGRPRRRRRSWSRW